MLPGDCALFLGRNRGHDAAAIGLRQFDRRQADAARCAEHEDGFALLDIAAVLQAVDRGAIGHQQRAGFYQVDPLGYLEQPFGRHRDLFLQPAIADAAHHAVTNGEAFDALAQCLDRARDLATRSKRAGRLELVHVADNQRVGKIDGTGSDLDQHFALGGGGGVDILDDQGFGSAGFL